MLHKRNQAQRTVGNHKKHRNHFRHRVHIAHQHEGQGDKARENSGIAGFIVFLAAPSQPEIDVAVGENFIACDGLQRSRCHHERTQGR